MKKFQYLLVSLIMSVIIFSACDKDDPKIPNEEEVITTLRYTLSPEGDNNEDSKIVLSFQDLDGDGGKSPVIMGANLKANTTYLGTLELLNELGSPAEKITEEIQEEDEAHQFFFESSLKDLSIAYADKDEDENPIGLKTKLITQAAGQGTLKITLRHEPNKTAEGVSDGDIKLAGGETDIEIIFDLDVE